MLKSWFPSESITMRLLHHLNEQVYESVSLYTHAHGESLSLDVMKSKRQMFTHGELSSKELQRLFGSAALQANIENACSKQLAPFTHDHDVQTGVIVYHVVNILLLGALFVYFILILVHLCTHAGDMSTGGTSSYMTELIDSVVPKNGDREKKELLREYLDNHDVPVNDKVDIPNKYGTIADWIRNIQKIVNASGDGDKRKLKDDLKNKDGPFWTILTVFLIILGMGNIVAAIITWATLDEDLNDSDTAIGVFFLIQILCTLVWMSIIIFNYVKPVNSNSTNIDTVRGANLRNFNVKMSFVLMFGLTMNLILLFSQSISTYATFRMGYIIMCASLLVAIIIYAVNEGITFYRLRVAETYDNGDHLHLTLRQSMHFILGAVLCTFAMVIYVLQTVYMDTMSPTGMSLRSLYSAVVLAMLVWGIFHIHSGISQTRIMDKTEGNNILEETMEDFTCLVVGLLFFIIHVSNLWRDRIHLSRLGIIASIVVFSLGLIRRHVHAARSHFYTTNVLFFWLEYVLPVTAVIILLVVEIIDVCSVGFQECQEVTFPTKSVSYHMFSDVSADVDNILLVGIVCYTLLTLLQDFTMFYGYTPPFIRPEKPDEGTVNLSSTATSNLDEGIVNSSSTAIST